MTVAFFPMRNVQGKLKTLQTSLDTESPKIMSTKGKRERIRRKRAILSNQEKANEYRESHFCEISKSSS